VARHELDADHPSEAVAHDDRLLNPDRGAERREVVGEGADLITTLRDVALPTPTQVDGRDRVRSGEMVELGLERCVVATPAGDEQQLTLPAARPLVEQLQSIQFRVWQDTVRSHARGAAAMGVG
jgi:hypothetical protein